MRRLLITFFLLLAAPSTAGILPLLGVGKQSASFTPTCTESSNFIMRAVVADASYDVAHQTAVNALICGLVTDSVWSKFDALYILATQSTAVAVLSLVSATYNATEQGGITFTTDRGYNGVNGSVPAKYLTTGFNPSTAPSPKFVQNSAHLSAWSVTNVTSDSNAIMGAAALGSNENDVYPRFTDGNSYYVINGTFGSVSNTGTNAHFLGNRSSSTGLQGYKNGASVLSTSVASQAPLNRALVICGYDLGSVIATSGYQVGMASIGSSLSSTDATNFYNRLRTYMTAVGVP